MKNRIRLMPVHSQQSGNRLLLAFDAGCFTCSRIADYVRSMTDGVIATVTLDNPAVKRWLDEANQSCEPKPTLFSVNDTTGEVIGYQGLGIGRILTQTFGLRRAWSIAQVVGEGPLPKPAGPDRRQFLRGVVAAGAASLLLTGSTRLGKATAGSKDSWDLVELTPSDHEKMQGLWNEKTPHLVESALEKGYQVDGKTQFQKVLHNSEYVRSVGKLSLVSEASRVEVWLTVERGDIPLSHIVRYVDEAQPELIEVQENRTWSIVDPYAKMAAIDDQGVAGPDAWPSRCGICQTACSFAAAPGIVNASACTASCMAASGGIGAPICAVACFGLAGLGALYINEVGCPTACRVIRMC